MQVDNFQLSVYSLRFIKRAYNTTIPTHFELSINLQLVTRNLQLIANYTLLITVFYLLNTDLA